MDAKSTKELADAMKKVFRIREASWDTKTHTYKLSYYAAAEKAKIAPSIKDLVTASLQAGYVEFPEWSEKQGRIADQNLAKEMTMARSKPKVRR